MHIVSMRPIKAVRPRFACARTLLMAFCAAVVLAGVTGTAQQLTPGRNVNMVSGTKWPDGDPYLQRQNEPSVAASTRNPLHLLAGANDYRTVDIPFVDHADEIGDAWLGVFKSFDGGQRWRTSLLPGYPQDTSAAGMASPLKGYTAGADPVVRAGTNGLIYYNGLVFERKADGGGKSAIFLARFIDNNDREAGDSIKYLGTSLVAQSPGGTGGAFLDKPWLAVDIPRGGAGTCRISTSDTDPKTTLPRNIVQTVPAGAAYVVYTAFTRDSQGERADIFFTRSENCGVTWTPSVRINNADDRLNQGGNIAIDPRSGDVYVAWRRFASLAASPGSSDGLMIARYNSSSRKFLSPGLVRKLPASKFANLLERISEKRRPKVSAATTVTENSETFDQATTDINSSISFRTNAYPTLAIDGSGRLYMAWSERGFGSARPSAIDGDARIVMATSINSTTWSTARPVADETTANNVALPGHQFMPTLTVGAGKLVLAYYDLRDDVSQEFSPFADDKTAITIRGKRRTLDLRASLGSLGAAPVFASSIRVSEYLTTQVITAGGGAAQRQMQYNAPNLPMFKLGTAPFMGDYIDVTTAPAFVPTGNGRWAYNTSGQVVFHAVWTDNRDVRQPVDTNGDGNPWNDYTPPTPRVGASIFDATKGVPSCVPANTGSRNQNIYTARLSSGLIVGSPGNTKPLSSTQRAFSVFAQNATTSTRTFRMTIANQPPGGRASFDQFASQPLVSVDVTTAARSLSARTVYVSSTQPDASVSVTVREITGVGGAILAGGLGDVIILNPDISNPAISNPDISNPGISNPDISNAEVYNPDISNPDISNPDISNPDISNPDISNPDISNPDISNPDISNPDISNVVITNPDISNPDISNPDISNPDISNPDISNPDISNPDISNTTLTDVTWSITNKGNTAASFNVNLFLAQATTKLCAAGQTPSKGNADPSDDCIATQLILSKAYSTPTTTACAVQVQTQTVLIANIPSPRFVTPGTAAVSANDSSVNNATLWLGPGETARLTLRIADPNRNDNATFAGKTIDPVFFPTTSGGGGLLTPFVTQQAINTDSISEGGVVRRYPASVFFVQQPVTTPLGFAIAPPVSVQVRDQLGAPLANAVVTIGLTRPAPGGATVLGGESILTDTNGIATFPALLIDRAGAGYQLEGSVINASTTTAISNKSVLFDVPLAVVNTLDSGPGSLRFALEQANLTPGVRETVVFAIPGSGPHTISPLSALPEITDAVAIDGRTQPGYAPRLPAVVVSGLQVPGESADAVLRVAADNVEIRGLFVRDSDQHGIRVRGSAGRVSDDVVSKNVGSGIFVAGGTGNTIAANIVGLSRGGLLPALPNRIGIEVADFTVDESSTPAHDTVVDLNVVSGNSVAGIILRAAGGGPHNTSITRNYVGVDATGLVMAGNGSTMPLGGIVIEADRSTLVGNGNLIAGNFGPGTTVSSQSLSAALGGVTIGGNSIHGNTGLGIDLGGNGVTANDAGDGDIGPNGLQNYPILEWARNGLAVGMTTVRGTLNSTSLTRFSIRVYSSASCDVSGFGEGEREEHTFEVNSGESGIATFQHGLMAASLAAPVGLGRFVTVTATPLDGADIGKTSEFSNCVEVTLPPPVGTITSVTPSPVGSNAGGGQMIVIRGAGMPATGASGVLYRQGGADIAATYTFTTDPTLVIARTPSGLTAGQATVRLTDATGIASTLPFSIVISETPGAPVLASLHSACAGPVISSVTPGDQVYVLADGVDTSGTTFVWARGESQIESAATATSGGPGYVCTKTTVPAALTSGTWSLRIKTLVGPNSSGLSNAITVTVPEPPPPPPPAGGLVSVWHADGNALDSAGSNHGALQGGAAYASGRLGQAFSFANPRLAPSGAPSTSNQHVLVGDQPSLRMTTALTMAAWILPTSQGLYTNADGLGVGEGGVIVNKEYAYEMARFADGSIRWAFYNASPGWNWINSGAMAELNVWSHVAVTYNNGQVQTYLNGALVSTVSGSGSLPPGSGLRIGGRELTGTGTFRQNFDGRIDEVGIYNTALTPAQVQALYNFPPATTIASVSPGTGAPGNGFIVLRGSALPNPAESAVVVTNGETSANGFVFLSPSTTSGYWVRLPSPFPLGPATMQIRSFGIASNTVPITVSATPGVPIITDVFTLQASAGFQRTSTASPGAEIYVAADGIDTLGWELQVEQNGTFWTVTPNESAYAASSSAIGLTIRFNLPAFSPAGGPVRIRVKQGGSAFSETVTLNPVATM